MIGRYSSQMGLVIILGGVLLFAERPASGSQQQPTHAALSTKRTAQRHGHAHRRHSAATVSRLPVQVYTGGSMRTLMFDAQPSRTAQQIAGRTTVEVINGAQKSTRVFKTPTGQGTGVARTRFGKSRRKRSIERAAAQPAPQSVETFNGRTSYVTTFETAENQEPTEAASAHPVVTGIESSRIRNGVEKSPPVVVAVTSSEVDNTAGNAEPMVTAVVSSGVESNRPVSAQAPPVQRLSKRRPYVPHPPK